MMFQQIKRAISALVLITTFTLVLSSCYSQKIVVGNGAPSRSGTEAVQNEESTKAWFFLFGLIPATPPIDLDKMAKGASNYTAVYEENVLDRIIGAVTIGIVWPRTVTVKR
mgnify:CR=1 FL=1